MSLVNGATFTVYGWVVCFWALINAFQVLLMYLYFSVTECYLCSMVTTFLF